MKAEEGRRIFARLASDADVLVENFRPGVMERLGFSWPVLHELNARLVYCAISGFGQTGPDAFKPAYDQIIQGLSGVMAVNGDERLNPLRCGFPVCDTVGGLNAAFAIMGALYHRERTGSGQFIDVALLDSVMPLLGWVAANWLIGGRPPVPMGNDNFTAAPSGTFVTRDGYINIAANQQAQWENLADAIGAPELKGDPRFQKRDVRKANRAELTPLIEEKLRLRTTAEWVCLLNRLGIPSGAIPTLQEALASPQTEHRQTLETIAAPGIGDLRLFTVTAKFDETPGHVESPPPRLGQHTDEVLREAGFSDEEIGRFRASGAL
jgi:crotonobetainyl-CoA:carnitine CoA-transferase CaiB-like acyl-CoA transferase